MLAHPQFLLLPIVKVVLLSQEKCPHPNTGFLIALCKGFIRGCKQTKSSMVSRCLPENP